MPGYVLRVKRIEFYVESEIGGGGARKQKLPGRGRKKKVSKSELFKNQPYPKMC